MSAHPVLVVLGDEGDGNSGLPDHGRPRVAEAVADPGLQERKPLEEVVSEGGRGQDEAPEALEACHPVGPVGCGQPGKHAGQLLVQHLGAQDHGHAPAHAELADEVLLVHCAATGLPSRL